MVRTAFNLLLLSVLAAIAWSYRQEIAAHPATGPWLADLREEIARRPAIGKAASQVAEMFSVYAATEAPPSQSFITVRAETGFIEQSVSVTGTLNAVMTVELGSQLPGQIAKRLVDFNDPVVRDQPLAELNRDSFTARVDEARASLEMANASVEIQMARLRRAEIDFSDAQARRAVLQARIDNARVRVEAAQRDHGRQKTLASRNAATTTSVENTQSAVASAEALLREEEGLFAVQAFAIAGAKVDMERLRSELVHARATVAQREALLQIARIDLERTTIRSPIDGVVVGRAVNEGQIIAIGLEARTLFVIARDLSEMEIHARVDEADIGKIQAGQRAAYTVDAYPGRRFEATVRQVRRAPQMNQNIVTYTVVLTAANPQNILLPGMTAVVRIITGREGPAITVPLAALRYLPASQSKSSPETPAAGPRVWVLRESAMLAVNVKLGAYDDNNVAVLQGALEDGDQIVIGEARSAPQNRLFGIRLGL